MKAEDLKAEDLIKGGWPEKNAREVTAAINGVVAAAVAEEREACLRIVDEYVGDYGETWERPVVYIHNAIRERGQSGQTGPVS